MLFYRASRLLQDRIAAWAKERGIPVPDSIPLAPAPPHVDADLALSWPLAAAKAAGSKPQELAAELAGILRDAAFEKVEAAPPGFINIRFSDSALLGNLLSLCGVPARYGAADTPPRVNILLEFVSANPTGPLHLASGRAAALGDSLARILRRLGYTVGTEYYINDAGRQVGLLGLSVKARYDELHGKEAALPEGGYQGDYVREIAAQAPPEAARWTDREFGRYAVGRILELHQRDMEDYRAVFDRWFAESDLHRSGALKVTLDHLRMHGMVYEKEGAVWLGTASKSDADDKDRVIVKSDGTPSYFLADIAYHKDKYDRGWARLIDIWGADHHGHVPRMKAAMAALGKSPEAFHALLHQLVHLVRGGETVKMSKRAGEFVTLRELMEEAGVDACRFFFAMHAPNTHMNFDLELAKKKAQDNPVFYVQYVHARIASIFREAAERGVWDGDPRSLVPEARFCQDPEARALLVKIAWFPHVLEACAAERSPHPLTTYLMELAGLYHAFYENCRVVDEADKETSLSRLALCDGVRQMIREGLGLLGVSAPEKM